MRADNDDLPTGASIRFVVEPRLVPAAKSGAPTPSVAPNLVDPDEVPDAHLGCVRNLLNVPFQNPLATPTVGPGEGDLAIESPCAQQGGIEDVGAIRRREQQNAIARIEAAAGPIHAGKVVLNVFLAAWILRVFDACQKRSPRRFQGGGAIRLFCTRVSQRRPRVVTQRPG
jgi:hypothetical protein